MADERALASRARTAARRVTGGRRGGAVGAAVDAARSVYRRIADEDPAEPAGDAEIARLRAELDEELRRLASRTQ
jgi:hypothetical protein